MKYFGLALMPVSCLCSSSGLLLMKSATEMRPDLPIYRNPRWLVGFFLLAVCATTVDVIVLGLLPLSVIAPFAGLTIVFSILLAASGWVTAEKEQVSRADAGAVVLVLAGVSLVSSFGPRDGTTPTLDALVRGYSSLRFALFAAVAYSAAALAVALSKRGASPTTDDDTPGGPKGGADAGGAPASGGVGAVALSAYAAAHCGAMSQLMLKLVSCSLSAMPAALRYLLFGLGGLAVSAPLHLKLLR